MPTFDYFCNCGESKIDEIVKSYREVITCDKCSEEMERGICAPNLNGFDKNGTSKNGGNG